MNIIWISFYDATNGLPAKDFTSLTNLNKRFIRLNKTKENYLHLLYADFVLRKVNYAIKERRARTISQGEGRKRICNLQYDPRKRC